MDSRITHRLAPLALTLSVLYFSGAELNADLLVGRVVDSNGVGVPGVDIDVDNTGSGGDPDIFNDGTDANGFFSTTVPAGLYDVIFSPLPPPTTSHLVQVLRNVVHVGTTNLGDVVLPAGITLSGRVIDDVGLPVANVNLDVIDDVLGQEIIVRSDFTNGFGIFQIAVPPNKIELRIDVSGVIGRVLVSRAITLAPTGPFDIGELMIETGHAITGTVTNSAFVPVEHADIDLFRLDTGEKVFTPGDNTNVLGAFMVVAPPGLVDIEICPPNGQLLIAAEVEDVVVTAPVALASIALQTGVLLTGLVTDGRGLPVPGTDLDVVDSVSGLSVPLCRDNADGTGTYSIVVPSGTMDVTFSPPFAEPFGMMVQPAVPVAGPTVLNAVVPDCAFATNYGRGISGSGGFTPRLEAVGGAPRPSNSNWALQISDTLGGETGLLILSFEELPVPVLGGFNSTGSPGTGLGGSRWVRVDAPKLFLFAIPLSGAIGVPGTGSATFSLPVPLHLLVGNSVYGQVVVEDPAARGKLAMSSGFRVTFCL